MKDFRRELYELCRETNEAKKGIWSLATAERAEHLSYVSPIAVRDIATKLANISQHLRAIAEQMEQA